MAMLKLGVRLFACLVLPSLFVACDVGEDCEPIDCQNGVWVVVKPEGSWKAGDYVLEVTHDDETERCELNLPDLVPNAALTTIVPCGKARVNLYALSSCTDCSLDDPFELDLFLDELPKDLSVVLTRDGEAVLSDERQVEYDDIFPRGEECGGGCTQGRFELEVEYPE